MDLFLLFMFRVCHVVLFDHCSLVITCWKRADLLALLCVAFACVLTPDLCLLLYFANLFDLTKYI